MATAEAFAPAKINLTLHVTGQRDDGYHLIDSLVCFAGVGDVLRAEPGEALTLALEGPEALGLSGEGDNLVLRAARAFGGTRGAALTLDKRLPVASGIGGGSADAAAALRALSELWQVPLPDGAAVLALGADVPMCLQGRPSRVQGIGEILDPAPPLPAMEILLVNPRTPVSTPEVFRRLECRANPPMGALPGWRDAARFCDWLGAQRNDLLAPARSLAPAIDDALALIGASGALFTGMSGSGATCFGLYAPDGRRAPQAAERIRAARPGWWVQASRVRD